MIKEKNFNSAVTKKIVPSSILQCQHKKWVRVKRFLRCVFCLWPSKQWLTSSGWLISNRSSLLSFHRRMTLASFSRSSSSGMLFIYLFVCFSKSLCDFKPQTVTLTSCPCRVSLSPAGPRPVLSEHPSTSELINITLRFILHFILPSQHPSAPHSTGHWLLAMWNSSTFLIITRSQSTTRLINIQLFPFHCHRSRSKMLQDAVSHSV